MENKISIITPVFNGAKYIETTIKSILSQTYNNIEYIVVDGGSPMEQKKLLKNIEIKLTK